MHPGLSLSPATLSVSRATAMLLVPLGLLGPLALLMLLGPLGLCSLALWPTEPTSAAAPVAYGNASAMQTAHFFEAAFISSSFYGLKNRDRIWRLSRAWRSGPARIRTRPFP